MRLYRVSDPHDRDRMIYSNGAGAAVLEAREASKPLGVLAHSARTDTGDHAYPLWIGCSWRLDHGDGNLYLKMDGHKVYEYAAKGLGVPSGPRAATICPYYGVPRRMRITHRGGYDTTLGAAH